MSFLLDSNEPGGRRLIAKPFCIPDIEVTTNSLPDTRVAIRLPPAEMTVPLVAVSANEKVKVVEFAYRFWAPVSKKNSTGNVAKSFGEMRI